MITFRPATAEDAPFLEEMLATALNWDPDRAPLPETALTAPENRRYVEDWPRADDLGVIAVDGGPVGAGWLRFFSADAPGYGFIDAAIPEISIAVVADRRGEGIGGHLLNELAREARRRGITALSLSVEHGNRSVRLYERHGFRAVGRPDGSQTMRLDL